MHKLSTKEYILKARLAHNGWYDYSKTVYSGARAKLTVTCLLHGDFSVQASSHTNNRNGCIKCMGEKFAKDRSSNTEEFLAKATLKHGDRYDYASTVYRRVHDKVIIRCRLHGAFLMQPAAHLGGSGCPSCASYGYTHAKPGWLYVLTHENLTKVGITNRLPAIRTKEVNRSSGLPFKCVFKQKFANGADAQAIETVLLQELSASHPKHDAVYTGSTECFVAVDVDGLITKIQSYHNARKEYHVF